MTDLQDSESKAAATKSSVDRPIRIFCVSAILGAAIWFLSPALTGEDEPWDSQTAYYPFALFIAGIFSAMVCPRNFWIAPIGILFGQIAFVLGFRPLGPLVLMGLFCGVAYSLLSFVGAALVHTGWVLSERKRHEK